MSEPTTAKPKVATPKVAAAADADDELLEFLGDMDADGDEDGEWLDFLARTDIDRVAKVRRTK